MSSEDFRVGPGSTPQVDQPSSAPQQPAPAPSYRPKRRSSANAARMPPSTMPNLTTMPSTDTVIQLEPSSLAEDTTGLLRHFAEAFGRKLNPRNPVATANTAIRSIDPEFCKAVTDDVAKLDAAYQESEIKRGGGGEAARKAFEARSAEDRMPNHHALLHHINKNADLVSLPGSDRRSIPMDQRHQLEKTLAMMVLRQYPRDQIEAFRGKQVAAFKDANKKAKTAERKLEQAVPATGSPRLLPRGGSPRLTGVARAEVHAKIAQHAEAIPTGQKSTQVKRFQERFQTAAAARAARDGQFGRLKAVQGKLQAGGVRWDPKGGLERPLNAALSGMEMRGWPQSSIDRVKKTMTEQLDKAFLVGAKAQRKYDAAVRTHAGNIASNLAVLKTHPYSDALSRLGLESVPNYWADLTADQQRKLGPVVQRAARDRVNQTDLRADLMEDASGLQTAIDRVDNFLAAVNRGDDHAKAMAAFERDDGNA